MIMAMSRYSRGKSWVSAKPATYSLEFLRQVALRTSLPLSKRLRPRYTPRWIYGCTGRRDDGTLRTRAQCAIRPNPNSYSNCTLPPRISSAALSKVHYFLKDERVRAPEQCVILVGGLGTRLGSMTADMPKPLLAVGPRPFLEYLLWKRLDLASGRSYCLPGTEVSASKIMSRGAESIVNCKFRSTLSRNQSGPVLEGALWLARRTFAAPFSSPHGDSWFDFNWLSLITASGDAIGTMALRNQ